MDRMERQITEWLQKSDEEEEGGTSGDLLSSEDEVDNCIEELHDSQSETENDEEDQLVSNSAASQTTTLQQSDSSDEDAPLSDLRTYKTKSGFEWKSTPFRTSVRTQASNIRTRVCGPKNEALACKTSRSCFDLFLNDEMIDIITKYTNIYIEKIKANYQRQRDAKTTDCGEIRALIGMLLMIGVEKSGRRIIKDFWDNTYGTAVDAINLTMSQNRFVFLLKCLRFDDVNTRDARRETDKLAPIRELFDIFVKNLQKYYTPSDYLTLDEQLVAFRGRCGFRMFIPNKPDKYGIKLFALVDVQFPYAYNLEIYAGVQPTGPFQMSNKVPDIVHRMLKPLENTGSNVTMDNWFTSIPLLLELEKKKITAIGTLKSNKPDIPLKFKTSRDRPINDSLFGFHKKCTLVSYVPKPKKVVLVASTMHNDDKIDPNTGDARKPEIITEYNRTKCGVDVLDKMCKHFSVARNSRRWPLTIFFDMINIAGINGMIIDAMVNYNYRRISRRNYLRSVAIEYLKPQMQHRLFSKTIPRNLKERSMLFLGITENDLTSQEDDIPRKRTKTARCYYCGRGKDRSTRTACQKCHKPICNEHKYSICIQCYNQSTQNLYQAPNDE